MGILIFALVLILIVGLVIYAIDLIPLDARLSGLAKIIVIIIVILLLCDRAGLI